MMVRHRSLWSAIVPAFVAVPLSYVITRPMSKNSSSPLLLTANADSTSTPISSTEETKESYKMVSIAELEQASIKLQQEVRKDIDKDLTKWFTKVDATMIPMIETMTDEFANDLHYIYIMYDGSLTTTRKYLLASRLSSILNDTTNSQEKHIISVLVKYYNIV
jgi:hypothetical protein